MTVKSDVCFRITGPCLSLLLRDCECSVSDQVGFLIGEKSSITTQSISDEEMEEEKIETTISINGTFPIGLPFVFCSPLGRIDETSFKEIVGSCEKDVVGWYSFRRNCSHSASLRETLLHRELCRVLQHIPSQYFVFCIITTAAADRNATQSKRFTFFTLNNRKFQPVSVLETNLGEPEDNNYRRNTEIDTSFKHLQQVLSSLNGINSAKEAMHTLHTQSNKHIEALESSVNRLQGQVDDRIRRISSSNFNCAVVNQKSVREESLPSTSTSGSAVKPAELSEEY